MSVNFYFCDDLDAPELGIVMNSKWFNENREEILKSEGISSCSSDMFIIRDPIHRLTFLVRWR